ncbi:MAG TPA: bis(5'-nucleosyl)-tetraphosphatase (symmetrical) YqeK [Bacillota bacterium]|nr:bis(5'-nucleosyl)-tetraphosphatase (symmetrical) YqeK [Bacillota bacterium]HOH10644.1 bis(5'-nucleosyl)-tetraphosphatase (symmetrical) YqeK [Bacillota bacterium]HOY89580.1 bis(5'-nucleosyl)-tetraphosphatase (symmetrical) YqeK [Bacillota bacterium]HPI01961.1 bis(5'-nucleosyl)-tetraphosphatase (symmetrical) YqeK [Bacillota bacterium]HPM63749.1 bis(5'-nucleosyl)-tetraphosphatase (symmetrical) YqeK [Bacillota bacterium]
MERTEIIDKLTTMLSPARLKHTLNVEEMALKLAKLYHADEIVVSKAALLHDCAKEMPNDELLSVAASHELIYSDTLLRNPHLLHPLVGAVIAQAIFGINDPKVLMAVASHTLGRPDMSIEEKVIFASDYCELGRSFNMDDIRKELDFNIDSAILMILNRKISRTLSKNREIAPESVLARNWILNELNTRAKGLN